MMGSSGTQQIVALCLGVLSGSLMVAILVFVPHMIRRRKRVVSAAIAGTHSPPTAAATATATGAAPAPASAPTTPLSTIDATANLTGPLLAIIISFIYGMAIIFIYRLFDPTHLVWFGVAEIMWFLLGLVVYAVRKIAIDRKLREKQ
ncbi:MAG: hypothetical protein LBS17_01035 [Actinomycetes bacterium]|jgi:hypothetical protein|nr:hypothetical protein [Actinomycetes bacterium]